MARKQPVFFRRIKSLLKYVLLGVGIALLMSWGQGNFDSVGASSVFASTPTWIAQVSQEQLRIEAQSLTTQGHEQLALGKAEEALKTWERAMEVYAQIPDREGVRGSQINQSIALQSLGQYRRACKTLLTTLNIGINNQICEPSTEGTQTIPEQPKSLINAIALRTFGDVLRGIGKLDQSLKALQQGLKIARNCDSPPDISMALLSLGNTERASYIQILDLYRRTNSSIDKENAKSKANQALNYYQQAANLFTPNMTQIQAKLNRLSLLLEFESWLRKENLNSDAEDLQPKIESLVADLRQNQAAIANLPLSQTAIYAKINFAQSLNRLEKNNTAIQYALDALQQAKTLKDQRLEAYALGTLGNLYEHSQSLDQAQKLTQQALGVAQAIQAWDISYEWQWQLGRIYKAQGNIEGAIAAYDVAVKDLDRVRKDLLPINPDIQFSFQNDVEPVYREVLKILLRTEASPDNIERASEVTSSLQLAELETFVQCDLADLVPIDKVKNPPTAIIYPILLEDRIEIIVKLPRLGKVNRYTTYISQEKFIQALDQLKGRLREKWNDVNRDILPPAQKLYKWLIEPALPDLPAGGTLVFVLDSTLQSIPMAVLHDGKQYLVQKYSIAFSLGSQLPNPKSLPPGQWKALLAGVSEKDGFPPDLPPLPNVKDELSNINAMVPSLKLLNRQFTNEAFQKQISETPFPVVHLATHGEFSSDPEKTLIYAWKTKIRVKELDNILRSRGKTIRDPIELLVLSACETAQGDQRAALGLAGVALRARARSTVASLWKVSDESTARFMKQFYEELNKKNTTKAEALRQVQLMFLNNSYDQHPYYWAAFILSGNWL